LFAQISQVNFVSRFIVATIPRLSFYALVPLSSSQFTREFVIALRREVPDHKILIVRDLQLKITGPGGHETDGFLEHAYTQYMIAPNTRAARSDVMRKYVLSMVETLKKVGESIRKDRIVAVMKDRTWLQEITEMVRARGVLKTMENVHEVYNEELVIAYAEDTPNNIRYLTSAGLKELNLELKDLRPLACANLEKLLPAPDIRLEHGAYRIRAGRDYDVSLLLLDHIWGSGRLKVRGEIVVGIPARDCLLATGSDDEGGLQVIRTTVQKVVVQVPHRLTSTLFVRRGGAFVRFEG